MLILLALLVVALAQTGPKPFDLGADPAPQREYRSFSGKGNNLANPLWGSAFSTHLTDKIASTRSYYNQGGATGTFELDPNRVNERLISVKLAKATHRGQELVSNLLNQLHTEFGHFMVLDLSNTMDTGFPPYTGPADTSEPIRIPTNIGDDAIDYEMWQIPGVTKQPGLYPCDPTNLTLGYCFDAGGPFFMPTTRYADAPGTGKLSNGTVVAERINTCTSYIDLSHIYGVYDESFRHTAVFNDVSGYLHVDAPWLFPVGTTVPSLPWMNVQEVDTAWVFGGGDARINKNPSLRFFSVLYQMEHNRLVKEFRAKNPTWNGTTLFQEARRLTIAHMQATTIREYLGSTLGNPLDPYPGYDPTVNVQTDIIFSTSTFRYGHSAATPLVPRIDRDGVTPCAGGSLLVRDITFLPSRWLVSDPHHLTLDEMNCFVRGFSLTLAGKVDAGFVDDVRNFMIGGTRHGFDLLSLNIFRGHDNGLPDYNTVRVIYGLPAKTSYADITSNVLLQNALQDIYGPFATARIDCYVGMMSEDHFPGASVGELVRVSMIEQFNRTRNGDRFWYQNVAQGYYTQAEVDTVHATKLRDLMVRNFGMGELEIPTSPFYVEKRQLDRPVTGDELFLFPALQPHPTGLEWYTTLLAPFYQLSWAIERYNGPHKITFQIQTSTMGWVGLGFKPDPNTMKNADIVLCRLNDTGLPECRDSKALEVGEPLQDIVVGGTADVTLDYYSQANGFTTVVFSRLVDTGDYRDWPITDDLQIIFAFNPETNQLRYHGPTRSSKVTLDFLALYKGPPTQVYVSLGIQIWLYISAGFGICQALFMMILIVIKKPYFHFQTPEFCILICLGAIMGHIATILITYPNPTDGMCWANLWLFGMSFWFVFTCLFAKVFRIWWTVQAAEKMKIKPVKIEMLLIPLLICCILEGVFQACWDGIAVVRPNVDVYQNPNLNQYTYYCAGNEWMWLGSVLVRAMFLLVGVWLALETRKMQKSLNWSREIALAMYTMALICFVLIPLGFAISNSPTLVVILKGIGYTYSYILILFIVFADTLYRIFSGKDARTLDSSAILSSNSGSMTGGSSSDVSVGIKSTNKSVS